MSLKLAILISGRGSNMVALADHIAQENVAAQIVAVIADRPAGGLEQAKQRNLPVHEIFTEDYHNKESHEEAVKKTIDEAQANVIFLAGYMRILSKTFCSYYQDRIFNIHPSLLPRHKGLDTHQKAIDAGDEIHGCSVHLVSPEMDGGVVIAQREVAVSPRENAEQLADKVLREEHRLYPALLKALATGALTIKDGNLGMDIDALTSDENQKWDALNLHAPS